MRTSFQELIGTDQQVITVRKSVKAVRSIPAGSEFIDICKCGTKVSFSAVSEGRVEKIGVDTYQGVCHQCSRRGLIGDA